MIVIDVATQFDPYPFGRYPKHGPFNGERFREELLLPPLRKGETVVVDLTHTIGAAASFLEESFGGLLRAGLSRDFVEAHVSVRSDTDPSLISEVENYIEQQAIRDAEGAS